MGNSQMQLTSQELKNEISQLKQCEQIIKNKQNPNLKENTISY